MFHLILVRPEIPPNTGNVIRLTANTGATLHLVHPLGFTPTDSKLKRAGLDYHAWASVHQHDNLAAALAATQAAPSRCFAMTTKAQQWLGQTALCPGDAFVFGSETAGLAPEELTQFSTAQRLRLPMRAGQRSLNLSNAVAITAYEAWRQAGYAGGV